MVADQGGLTDSETITVKIVEEINYPPEIIKITPDESILPLGGFTKVSCVAFDPNEDLMTYTWSASSGTISGEGNTVDYSAPSEETNVYLICRVSDTDGESAKDSVLVLVRDPSQGQTGDLVAHYIFNNNADDVSGNGHNGLVKNCIFTEDMFGNDKEAIKFNISDSKVIINNSDNLNFRQGLTVSYWINIQEFFEHESYPISHGNWTTRWKTSLTDEYLRFTIAGTGGTIDVDSDDKLVTDKWIHVVALYDGFDCLVFIDGILSGFKPYEGEIFKTSYDLVLGQSLPDQSGFNFKGLMDNLRIYNYGISYDKVKEIYQSELLSIIDNQLPTNRLNIFPNPVNNVLNVETKTNPNQEVEIRIANSYGQTIYKQKIISNYDGFVKENLNIDHLAPGIYMLILKANNFTISKKFISK